MKKYLIVLLICLANQQLKAQSEKALLLLELNVEYKYFKISIDDGKDFIYIQDNFIEMERYVRNSKVKANEVKLKRKTKKEVLYYLDAYASIKKIQAYIGLKKDKKTKNILNSMAFKLRESLDKIYQNTIEKEFIKELDILSGIYASSKKFYPLYESSQDLLLKHRELINKNYSLLNVDYPKLNKFIDLLNKKDKFSDEDLKRISSFYNTELKVEFVKIIENRLKN